MNTVPALPAHVIFLLLLQLAALLAAARGLGELAKRIHQPAVIGELLAGILLGPSVLGWVWPWGFQHLFPPDPLQAHLLEMVAWLGMVLLLLLTGLETDVRLLRHLGRAALSTSLLALVVPFSAGFAFGELIPERYLLGSRHLFAAFFATSTAICAMPIIAKILFDLQLARRNVGVVILSAGVVNDTAGWVILSVLAGIAKTASFDLLHLGKTVGLTLGFIALVRWGGFPLIRWFLRLIDDHSHAKDNELAFIVIITLVGAAVTEWIGIHAMFGAFVAGCVIRQSPRVRRTTFERLESVTMALFAPIFFGRIGLKVDLRQLDDPALFFGVITLATASMLVGGTLGGLLGRMSLWESLAIGAGMNARGAMGLVVALIGLNLGILGEKTFSVIVMVAVVTSFMAPPLLRWLMRNVPVTPEERARMSGKESSGLFNPRLLKVLLPTAGGPNALAAAQLGAALVRGEGASLITLFIDRSRSTFWVRLRNRFQPDLAGRNLTEHLMAIRALAEIHGVRHDSRSHVDGDPEQAILREASRGMDLLLVGAAGRPGQELRTDLLTRLLEDAPCHLGIVNAGRRPARFRRLLVPSDGSYFSRAAVELAVLFAERSGAQVTILHIVQPTAALEEEGEADSELEAPRQVPLASALLPMLETTSAQVANRVRADQQPNRPVLRELRRGIYDLLIVGVEARALRHRLSIGFDVEQFVSEAPCSSFVVVPRLEGGA